MSTPMPQLVEIPKQSILPRSCLVAAVFIIVLLAACSSKYTVKSSESSEFKGEINRHVRVVEADQGQVFKILTCEKAFGELCPEGTFVTHESPLHYREGLILKTKIDHLFKLEWFSQVEEITSDHSIRLKFLDGFFSDGTEIWELEEIGQSTRISHTIVFQPDGFLKRLAWLLKVRTRHDEMVEVFLDNLDMALSSPGI
jgi:ribosome-associated toxin RatA of RatAB toxin-antitoxin module